MSDVWHEHIWQLCRHHGCNSLAELGRHYYDESDCGVNVTYLTLRGIDDKNENVVSTDDHRGMGPLPNEWVASAGLIGISFGTIVEGSDAEFQASPVYFPCDDDEIKEAIQYLEDLVDSYLNEQPTEKGLK